MLDRNRILKDPSGAEKAFLSRGLSVDMKALLTLDSECSDAVRTWESLRERRNALSSEIGLRKKKKEPTEEIEQEVRSINQQIDRADERKRELEGRREEMWLLLPNIPHESVPVGKDESENPEIRRWGSVPAFSFPPKPHWEIGTGLGILDFDRASKISGSRFSILSGEGARLERALVAFMLDHHTRDLPDGTASTREEPDGGSQPPYRELSVPYMVLPECLQATGQLPKFREELFHIPSDDLYLIPTAEVPVTNFYRGEILEEHLLPVKFAAYTACFRREAGAAGKDTRGLIRQHQFDKVELVWLSTPEQSWENHEILTEDAARVLERLGLPYRVISLCTGDLGFSSAKTYDIEVWFPSQNRYREISSCSNFEDFQARRAQIRFRRAQDRKVQLVHTLNGSGLAIGRTLAAILENFQTEEGGVRIPEVLVPYMGGAAFLGRKGKTEI
jgi:seryl-tRNA synthetase